MFPAYQQKGEEEQEERNVEDEDDGAYGLEPVELFGTFGDRYGDSSCALRACKPGPGEAFGDPVFDGQAMF